MTRRTENPSRSGDAAMPLASLVGFGKTGAFWWPPLLMTSATPVWAWPGIAPRTVASTNAIAEARRMVDTPQPRCTEPSSTGGRIKAPVPPLVRAAPPPQSTGLDLIPPTGDDSQRWRWDLAPQPEPRLHTLRRTTS